MNTVQNITLAAAIAALLAGRSQALDDVLLVEVAHSFSSPAVDEGSL